MHVAAILGVAFAAFLALVLLAGLTPFVGIPIFAAALGVLGLLAASAPKPRERPDGDVPSTEEAAYDPVVRADGPTQQ